MKGLFITGTDTDVGKTWVTGRLCRSLRDQGVDAGVWKPVQSGFAPKDTQSDAWILKQVSGVADALDEICPVTLPLPLAPVLAAHLVGKSLSCNLLLEKGQLLFEKHEVLLVEGAGGFLVPIAEGELIADLAQHLGLPVLIIARHGLGTVNHCLLTIEAIRQRGLEPMGVILNGYPSDPERVDSWEELPLGTPLEETSPANPLLIEQFSGVPVLGMIPRVRHGELEKPLDTYVNLERIVKRLT